MAEAAALRDAATVAAQLRDGESPTERRSVRAGILFDRPLSLTPMEAALAARRPEIVSVLIGGGAVAGWTDWAHARCLAARVEDADIARALDEVRPSQPGDGVVDCTAVRTPW